MKPIDINGTCPCGSGNRIRGCRCLQPDGRLVPLDVSTRPKAPKTGYANPKCYAGNLQDCSTKITGEHPLTKSILDDLQSNGCVLTYGMRWTKQPYSLQIIPVTGLQSKILCTRHNSVLSGLDTVGTGFFRRIKELQGVFNETDHNRAREFYLFNGHDVERWMLKLLCGVVGSKNHSSLVEKLDATVPEEWLQVLYGFRYFNEGLGMYYVDQSGQPRSTKAGVSYNVLWDGTISQILGIYIGINNMGFFLAVASLSGINSKLIFPRMIYRLGGFSFVGRFDQQKNDEDRKTILLGWRQPYTEKLQNVIVASNEEMNKRFS